MLYGVSDEMCVTPFHPVLSGAYFQSAQAIKVRAQCMQ